jgi:hypothetical protein
MKGVSKRSPDSQLNDFNVIRGLQVAVVQILFKALSGVERPGSWIILISLNSHFLTALVGWIDHQDPRLLRAFLNLNFLLDRQ